MKKISKEQFEKIGNLQTDLDIQLENGFYEMIEDGEDIELDFGYDGNIYKNIHREGTDLYITMDYQDIDGLVYEDEEYLLNPQSTGVKLLVFYEVMRIINRMA